ncbi:MAG: GHKL domain-containing protein [Flavobacteriales bacterium]|nr:GHKL domain-containing protein [Flavobacteriales bacterium]
MSRTFLFLLISILLASLSWMVREPDADERILAEATRLQTRSDLQAKELRQGADHWGHALAELGASEWMRVNAQGLELERLRTGATYLGFIGDSLVCWSGQLPANTDLLATAPTAAQITLPDAVYQHAMTAIGTLHLHALAPVWTTPLIENRYIQRGFHPILETPNGLMAQPISAAGPLVVDASGQPLVRLAWRDGALDVGPWILLKLSLFLLSAAFVCLTLWNSCSSLAKRSPLAGVLCFVGALFVLRWSVLLLVPSAPFDRLAIFDPATYAASFALPSLGDLLVNAALLVLSTLFLRRALRHSAHKTSSFLWVFVQWCVLLASAAWVTDTIIGLVNDSSVDLDLYHVQSLNGASAAAVMSIAMLFAAWLLLADTVIHAFGRSSHLRGTLITGSVAIAGSILVHHVFGILDTVLFLWPIPLLALLYQADRGHHRFIHAVVGLGCLSVVATHVLTKYTRDREHRERAVLAERLSVREDPVVELLFREVAPSLRTDRTIHELITGAKPCSAGELDAAVRQIFFGGFWERYDVRVFAFDAEGRLQCASDGSTPRSIDRSGSEFTDHTALADMPDLFFEQAGSEGSFYHARLVVMPYETATPVQLFIELHPRSAAQSLGFPELLIAGEEPVLHRADRYAVARYENGVLAEHANTRGVPLYWNRTLGPDGSLWYRENGRQYFAKGSGNGSLITLGTPLPGLVDRATTFSYLFALFSLLLGFGMFVRALLRHKGIPALGIAAKVRAALVLFAVISLLFFGFGTQHLLTRQYTERAEANILEKARSAHMELQQKLDGQPPLDQTRSRYLDHVLGQLSNVLFSDITLYDLSGHMLASSRPQVFSAGLLGPRMDAVAYARMVVDQRSDFVHQESIGSANYQSAYLPLLDRKGLVLGYLSLPSFADQRQQEQERSGVLVAVVNLFVLLFALSILVALFISNWTTRPLDLLKRSMANVALQGSNRTLAYMGKDEVGQLVEVYNRKVEELRESAERLARSERESAWREMARQVAHEIKNPLTPMKLGIEHFQHAWDPQAPDARERLDRFSRSMVQQIDALNGVATAFSQFAQMPIAKPEVLDLGHIARAAVDVFHATPGITIELHEHEGLQVYVDREHLLRVFNNLLKNAVQAIPQDREGRIDVVLIASDIEAIVQVRDNGSGIPKESRERIFTPSFTTKSSGMGLGLAMVKRIVENAGGRVWYETREGEGTTFFIALPLRS